MNYQQLLDAAIDASRITGNHTSYELPKIIDNLSQKDADSLIADMVEKSKRFETPHIAIARGVHKRTGAALSDKEINQMRFRALSTVKSWAIADLRK